VAIDCEMVGAGANGAEDVLARVSVVNYFGQVLLDVFVKPTERVTDWRTKYSGIRPADVLNESGTLPRASAAAHARPGYMNKYTVANTFALAQPLEKVQNQVRELIKDRILIGHGLQTDLTILNILHPKDKLRDTGLYEPFRTKYAAGKMPALRKVVKGELEVDVQVSEHDSVHHQTPSPGVGGGGGGGLYFWG